MGGGSLPSSSASRATARSSRLVGVIRSRSAKAESQSFQPGVQRIATISRRCLAGGAGFGPGFDRFLAINGVARILGTFWTLDDKEARRLERLWLNWLKA